MSGQTEGRKRKKVRGGKRHKSFQAKTKKEKEKVLLFTQLVLMQLIDLLTVCEHKSFVILRKKKKWKRQLRLKEGQSQRHGETTIKKKKQGKKPFPSSESVGWGEKQGIKGQVNACVRYEWFSRKISLWRGNVSLQICLLWLSSSFILSILYSKDLSFSLFSLHSSLYWFSRGPLFEVSSLWFPYSSRNWLLPLD